MSSIFNRAHSFSFGRNSLVVPVGYVFVQLLYEIFHFRSTLCVPIFADCFSITQMVFSHIHYNRYLELSSIPFLLASFFAIKYAPPEVCPTFGVHIGNSDFSKGYFLTAAIIRRSAKTR